MREIDIDELKRLMAAGRNAAQYAWDHYEELAARKHAYTLYGPYAYGIGASIPSKPIPSKVRQLLKSTRRKDYLIYELDDDFNVLRTTSVTNHTEIECIYHHYQLDGVIYAYPFRSNEKLMYNDTVSALRFSDKKPTFYAELGKNSMFAQFFEYVSLEKMIFTEYWYHPVSKYSVYGYQVDHNAPIGLPNSPAASLCTEEVPEYIDFSHWFK